MQENLSPIDFSHCERRATVRNGQADKFDIIYNNELYFVKFGKVMEPRDNHPSDDSYVDSPTSEWLGCSVFEHFGIPVQETLLGYHNGRKVVACKDFVKCRGDDLQLVSFNATAALYMLGSDIKIRYRPERSVVLDILENDPRLEPVRDAAINRFWKTMVVDSIIGNYDRHDGNWGFLQTVDSGEIVEVAPVYDCASSFVPMMSPESMADYLEHPDEHEERIRREPKTCLLSNGKRIKYTDLLLKDYAYDARSILLEMEDDIRSLDIKAIIGNHPFYPSPLPDFFAQTVAISIKVNIEPALELAKAEEIERVKDLDKDIDRLDPFLLDDMRDESCLQKITRPPAKPILTAQDTNRARSR